ncbi:hypothetical protein L218DRAFT_134722 [Marasmius fiardii PR-910]|nr:hypothetical protein L218DRAFT_134722 [Marasmius fiardii PR-910]
MKYAENGLLKALVEAPLLNTVSTPFVMNPMPLPYNQITSLSVEHMISIRRFEDRLSLCLNLQKLQILGYNNFDAPGYDANPLTLPSLRYLSIKLHSDTSFSRDLPRHLEFPNLYEFDLSCAGFEPHEWPCQGLMSMLQSCSSSLGRLSLGCSKYSLVPTATRQIFQLLPNLTHLRISFGEDEHGFIEALLSLLTIPESLNDTSSIVLPKLSSLDVTVFKGASLLTENVGHSIVKMMMSRRRRGLLDWQNSLETPLALITGFFTFMLNPELYDTEARLQIKEASAHFLEITDAAQLGYANVHVIALPSYNTWEGP